MTLLLAESSLAQTNSKTNEDPLLTLISLLETDISTKTDQLDQDYAPGMINVLLGSELQARGARNVGEAINLVAGVHLPFHPSSLVVRGFGGISGLATGKTKYLLNGIALDNVFASEDQSIIDLPIELVEKIELIRGPGSAIYGENAFLGVVNVVTITNKDRVFARIESFNTSLLGGGFSFDHKNGATSSLQLSTYSSNGPHIKTGPDALTDLGQSVVSNAPGLSNEARRHDSLQYQYSGAGLTFMGQWLDRGVGDGFGVRNFLGSNSNRIVSEQSDFLMSLQYEQMLSENNQLEYKTIFKRNQRAFDRAEALPAGSFGIYPVTQIASSDETEDRYTFGIDLTNRSRENHTILLGLEASRARTKDVSLFVNVDIHNTIPGTPFAIPLPELNPFELGYENRDRDIIGAYVQDEISVNNRLDMTAGIRFDEYSDVGSNVSPRIALVYRKNTHNILKLQYAEAFRPPTVIELYNRSGVFSGNPTIKPETVKTLEANYIYKTMDTVFRTTFYHSRVEDLIALDSQLRFQNLDEIDSSGIEFELEQRMGQSFKLVANASFNDSQNQSTQQPLVGSVDSLAMLSLIYQPISRYSLVADFMKVGNRSRGQDDVRPKLKGYNVVNLTFNLFDVGVAGFDFRTGITNLFDGDVIDPALAETYPEDFPGQGRSYFLSATKKF